MRLIATALALLIALSALGALGTTGSSAAPVHGLAAPASDEAWARALVAALPRATTVNDRDGDKLFDDLEAAYATAGPGVRLPVIVSFVQGVGTSDGVDRVLLAAPDAPVEKRFTLIPAYAGALRLDEALAVASLDEVRQIEMDRPGAPELDSATAVMGADAVVDGMGITGDLDGDAARFTAQDVTIAILDTGIDGKHKDFADGKLLHFLDLGDGKKEAYDEGGHGTHVASIAAGLGLGKADYRGVAPGAPLVGIKIVGEEKSAMSLALEGYEWIVANKETYGIRVATMSFGFGIATDGTTALERAVDAAWDAGIVTFKSNGNSGPERSTMTVPAAARGILGVGAMLDPNGNAGTPLGRNFGFALSGFSSRGPTTDGRVKPDVVAPGQSIMAARSGTTDGYVELSGTSMASPFAAGVAALVIAANPTLTPDEVRDILTATAEDWGIAGPDIDYGHGRIQAREAVREALARAGRVAPDAPAPDAPLHLVRAGVATTGVAEGTFTIENASLPLAATFIAEGKLLTAEIRGPGDTVVGRPSTGAASRQLVVSFVPTAPGEYRYRVVAPPGTAFVMDVSHGSAGLLDDLPVSPLEGGAPDSAGQEGGFTVPGAGAAGVLGLLGIAAVLLRRRG